MWLLQTFLFLSPPIHLLPHPQEKSNPWGFRQKEMEISWCVFVVIQGIFLGFAFQQESKNNLRSGAESRLVFPAGRIPEGDVTSPQPCPFAAWGWALCSPCRGTANLCTCVSCCQQHYPTKKDWESWFGSLPQRQILLPSCGHCL